MTTNKATTSLSTTTINNTVLHLDEEIEQLQTVQSADFILASPTAQKTTISATKQPQEHWGKLILLSTSTKDLPSTLYLTKDALVIGRSSTADLVVDSKKHPRMISRQHATIIRERSSNGVKYRLLDHRSINGTFVNNIRIMNADIRHGDILMFIGGGKTEMNCPFKLEVSPLPSNPTTEERSKFEATLTEAVANGILYRFEVTEQDEDLFDGKVYETPSKKRIHSKVDEDEVVHQHVEPTPKKMRLTESEDNEMEALKAKLKEMEAQMAQQTEESAKLKEANEKLKHDLTVTQQKQEAITSAEIEQEFTCVICQELILHACTLQCSHTFCKACIRQWIKDKQFCPVCRKKCSQKPIRNISIENIMEKYLKNIDSSEKKDREKRIAELQKKEEEAVNQLKLLIDNAKHRGVKFLSMKDPWNSDEKKVFCAGIQKYEGRARSMYCELTGLNHEFVRSASQAMIMRICANLNIEPARKVVPASASSKADSVDLEMTREKVHDFIDGDSLQ